MFRARHAPKHRSRRKLEHPTVFAVHRDDIGTSRHRVLWAKDGDLNKAERRGHARWFKHWGGAVDFAAEKARQIGATKSKKIDGSHASYHG